MQINLNSPTFFPLKPVDSNYSRLPVIVQPDAVTPPAQRTQSSANTQVVPPANSNADSQQARFIRTFASSERNISQADLPTPRLPPQVLAYIQTASLQPTENKGFLLDERV